MFFKKKSKNKTHSCKVLFKDRSTKRKKNPKRAFNIKAKSLKKSRCASNPRFEKMKKNKQRGLFLNILFLSFILATGLLGAYIVINFVSGIRGGTTIDDLVQNEAFVEGIGNIPKYPKSEFVYEGRKNEEVVLKMLNQGISVYRLPKGTKTSTVYEFYEENLPDDGWEYLFTIPTSTETKLFGQYWTKSEKGLRIYIENNDVWYELIPPTDAKSALQARREQEIQRKRILESSTEQTLLPDFPWQLAIPREYLTKYASTDMGELQSVEIFKIGGSTKFIIAPIGMYDEGPYDTLLQSYLKKVSKDREEKWEVINSYVDFEKEREVLFARLLIEDEEGEAIVLMNKSNYVTYVILSNEKENPFFDEIVKKIREP